MKRRGRPTREQIAEAKAEYLMAIGSMHQLLDNILKTFDVAPSDELTRITSLSKMLKRHMNKEQAYLALAVAVDRLAKAQAASIDE